MSFVFYITPFQNQSLNNIFFWGIEFCVLYNTFSITHLFLCTFFVGECTFVQIIQRIFNSNLFYNLLICSNQSQKIDTKSNVSRCRTLYCVLICSKQFESVTKIDTKSNVSRCRSSIIFYLLLHCSNLFQYIITFVFVCRFVLFECSISFYIVLIRSKGIWNIPNDTNLCFVTVELFFCYLSQPFIRV